jgi:hypothetical protein
MLLANQLSPLQLTRLGGTFVRCANLSRAFTLPAPTRLKKEKPRPLEMPGLWEVLSAS